MTAGRPPSEGSQFTCIECGHPKMRATDTRYTQNGRTRRRRICPKCNARFTTYEISLEDGESRIIRKMLLDLRVHASALQTIITKAETGLWREQENGDDPA